MRGNPRTVTTPPSGTRVGLSGRSMLFFGLEQAVQEKPPG